MGNITETLKRGNEAKNNLKVFIEHLESQKKLTKKEKLLLYMLKGNSVSGLTMITKFNICSYRDVIYSLRKDGYVIKSRTITKDGIQREVWWLAAYDEEYVKIKDCTIF